MACELNLFIQFLFILSTVVGHFIFFVCIRIQAISALLTPILLVTRLMMVESLF